MKEPFVPTPPVSPRSADPATNDDDCELLTDDGSVGVPATEAVFAIEPDAPAIEVTVSVNVAVAPFGSDDPVQVIVPVAPTAGVVQLKPAGALIDWNSSDAGSASVIVTEVAASGPWFVTTIV